MKTRQLRATRTRPHPAHHPRTPTPSSPGLQRTPCPRGRRLPARTPPSPSLRIHSSHPRTPTTSIPRSRGSHPASPRHGRYNPGAESGAGIRNARLGEDLPDIRGHRGTDARATSHSAGGGLGFSPDPFLVRVQVLTLSPCPTNSLVRVSRQPIGKYVGPCP